MNCVLGPDFKMAGATTGARPDRDALSSFRTTHDFINRNEYTMNRQSVTYQHFPMILVFREQ